MEASIVDLRYKMKEVLEALDRRENVKILYHGKVKGIISPAAEGNENNHCIKVQEHPFFGMSQDKTDTGDIMNKLRDKRY